MARIRTIKPEFWASEQVMECSPMARLLFIGLWNFCDDAGNHVDSEKTIKAEIFPADDISTADVRRLLDELSSNSLIVLYSSQGKGFIHVTGWKHQKIERPSYKHPTFPGDDSSNVRRAFDDQSPPEGKGREWNGKEGKGEDLSSLRSDSSAPSALTLAPEPADLESRKVQRIRQIAVDAQEAFNRILAKPAGLLSKCSILNKDRIKAVEKSLPTARAICAKLYANERVTPKFWEDYFTEAAGDDFHSGRGPYRGEHANWKPDFEYLLREVTMARLFDRASSAEDAAA